MTKLLQRLGIILIVAGIIAGIFTFKAGVEYNTSAALINLVEYVLTSVVLASILFGLGRLIELAEERNEIERSRGK